MNQIACHASGRIESHRASQARPSATWRPRSRRASPSAALAGIVDGKLVDLSYPLEQGRGGQHRHRPQSRGAGAVPAQHRASAGGSRHQPVSRRAVRHRPGHRRGLLLRLRRRRGRSCRRTSRRSKRRCASSRRQDLIYERQMWPRDEAKAFFAKRGEPLKVQLIDEKTEGQTEVSCYTIKDKRHLHRLLRRPARAVDRQAEGVQAAQHVERLLEGRRAQPADAAHLRHRVPLRQGAEGAPARRSRKRRSATTASSGASSGCSRSIRGRRARRSGWTRARRSTTRSRTTCATCCCRTATSR